MTSNQNFILQEVSLDFDKEMVQEERFNNRTRPWNGSPRRTSGIEGNGVLVKNNNKVYRAITNNNGQIPRSIFDSLKLSLAPDTSNYYSFISDFFLRILLLICFLFLRQQGSFRMNIHHEDAYKYSYPYSLTEGVSAPVLYFITWVVPVLVIFLSYFWHMTYKSKDWKSKTQTNQDQQTTPEDQLQMNRIYYFSDFIDAFLCHSLSILITSCLIHFIKCMVGRPRPDMLSRCFPDNVDLISNSDFKESLPIDPNFYVCSIGAVNEKRMRSAFKSFPSGHAGYSGAACMFVCLYLGGKMGTFQKSNLGEYHQNDARKNSSDTTLLSTITSLKSFKLIFIIPWLMASVYIGITRIQDYRHHIEDVLVGLILGWVVSFICYKLYYPNLNSRKSHVSARQEMFLNS